jgi:hypothetical protein
MMSAMADHVNMLFDRCAGRALRMGVLLLSVLLLAAIGGARAARAQAAEAGLNIASPGPTQIAAIKTLGTHWVRMFVSWRAMQPAPGAIAPSAFGSYEQTFAQLPPGSKVILDVMGSPEWETGSADEYAPPKNPDDYAAFVGALAQHFGTKVSAYEIWNEEDAPIWWTGAPDPAAYAQLLQATYPVVKAADPSATVVLGGLTGNDYEFLEDLYKDGAKGSFDVVAVHTDTACNKLSPYEFLRGPENRLIPDSFLAYREVHDVMLANGDDKPIWMTELSWRTTSEECDEGAWAGQTAEGVTEEQQATYLRQAYHCMAEDPYVQVALWFGLQDEGVVTSGLLRADGSRKPSFAAMRSYVHEGDQLSEPCGQFSGPKITVASPANHTSYSGPLPINVSATSPVGVFRIRLECDGKLIRNYDGNYPTTLSGAIDWQGAKHIPYGWHTLTFLAYDKERNVSETSVLVYHARPGSKTSVRPSAGGGRKGGHGHKHASKRAKKHHGKH